jgi:hypothetical protein
MFCNHCGSPVAAGQAACPQCGVSMIWPQVAIAARVRVASQLHLLAVLWFVSGALFLIPATIMAVVAVFVTVPMAAGGADKIAFVLAPGLLVVLSLFFVLSAVLRFVAGWGLLKVCPWARTYALVMAFLELINPPLGTALGIYTLFVLLPEEAADEYRRMSLAVAGATVTAKPVVVA